MASNDTYAEITRPYLEESRKEKLLRKSHEFPFVPAGIFGAVVGLIYGVYKYKDRGTLPTSLYLIHLRMAAQGTIISAITLGVGYHMFKDYVITPHNHKHQLDQEHK